MSGVNEFKLYSMLQELDAVLQPYRSGEALCAEVRKISDLISTQQYRVAVIGEFNRGKSSLINALLGTRILPTDILPMTAAVTEVRYGSRQQIRIRFHDGTDRDCTLEELEQYATKRTAQSEGLAASVRKIEVYWPSVFLKNHIELLDTPGLNESERMSELTMQIIGDVDAAIVVFSPDSPLSMTEQGLILDLIRQPGIRHLVFVMNMLDRVRGEQKKEELLQNIRTRIQQDLLPRALEDGRIEPKKARRILESPAIFGVSARQALEGFERDDLDLLEESRFPDFKTQLLMLLTAAQGDDPQERAAAAVRAAGRELPVWQTAEQAALDTEIHTLEAQVAARKQWDPDAILPPAAWKRLGEEVGLRESGLSFEKQLYPRLQRMFVQELQIVTKQNNTDEVIRGCLQRAKAGVTSSMQGERNMLESRIRMILKQTAIDPYLSQLAGSEETAAVQAELQAHLKRFPQFGWNRSPVPVDTDLVGKEVMPQVNQALTESLRAFGLQILDWTTACGRILRDSRKRQSALTQQLEDRLAAAQRQLQTIREHAADHQRAVENMMAMFEEEGCI